MNDINNNNATEAEDNIINTDIIEEKIKNFLKESISKDMHYNYMVNKFESESVERCSNCMLPENYPKITFNENGICNICEEYEGYKEHANRYFDKNINDFRVLVDRLRNNKKSEYDCLICYSGGKDSSYVLHRLVSMGLKVLTFTLDNGYISKKAFENIERTTSNLNVKNILIEPKEMNKIFVESLLTESNVCNGCFKAVNTLGTKIAADHNINLVINGLSRGQIFEIDLHGLFRLGIFDEKLIEESLKLFRKSYYSKIERTACLLNVDITDEMLENINYVNYFRYDNVSTKEIYEYLRLKDKEWTRPKDTGASSSNCVINDAGIFVHIKDRGFHFYNPQVSWECRLGVVTREEVEKEIMGYETDYANVQNVLEDIGYYNAFYNVCVMDREDKAGVRRRYAFIYAKNGLNIEELKSHLTKELPSNMIPDDFIILEEMPFNGEGEIDQSALSNIIAG